MALCCPILRSAGSWLVAICLMGIGPAADAQTLRGGLWEISVSVEGAGPRTGRICTTQAASEELFMPRQNNGCRAHAVQRIAGTIRIQFTCAGSPVSGGAVVRLEGDTAYSGTGTLGDGSLGQVRTAMSGRWLGENCSP